MPRRPVGFWDKRSHRYYARLGDVNPKNGKRRAVMLKHEDGRDIAHNDAPAVAAAISRRLAETERLVQRNLGPTVVDVCQQYITWHVNQGSAERTIKDHHYHLNRFCDFAHGGVRYGDRAAKSIEPEDLWRVDEHMGSLRLLYASVMACWAWAAKPVKGREQTRLIPVNTLAKIVKPPVGKKTRKRVHWPEARRMLRIAAGRSRFAGPDGKPVGGKRRKRTVETLRSLCLQFIAWTGCRPCEASSLEWTDLDFSGSFCVIPAERTKTRKTGKDRRFAVPRRLMQALRIMRERATSHPVWVFVPAWTQARTSPRPKELIRWWREDLKPVILGAGVEIPRGMTLYWLRHEFQSTGMEVASAERVSAVAGNSPKVLLGTYTHQADESAKEVADLITRRRRQTQAKPTP